MMNKLLWWFIEIGSSVIDRVTNIDIIIFIKLMLLKDAQSHEFAYATK